MPLLRNVSIALKIMPVVVKAATNITKPMRVNALALTMHDHLISFSDESAPGRFFALSTDTVLFIEFLLLPFHKSVYAMFGR